MGLSSLLGGLSGTDERPGWWEGRDQQLKVRVNGVVFIIYLMCFFCLNQLEESYVEVFLFSSLDKVTLKIYTVTCCLPFFCVIVCP